MLIKTHSEYFKAVTSTDGTPSINVFVWPTAVKIIGTPTAKPLGDKRYELTFKDGSKATYQALSDKRFMWV